MKITLKPYAVSSRKSFNASKIEAIFRGCAGDFSLFTEKINALKKKRHRFNGGEFILDENLTLSDNARRIGVKWSFLKNSLISQGKFDEWKEKREAKRNEEIISFYEGLDKNTSISDNARKLGISPCLLCQKLKSFNLRDLWDRDKRKACKSKKGTRK
jgi:hypothetical protein